GTRPSGARIVVMRWWVAGLALSLASCSQFVRYTEELRTGQGGRTGFVTVPTLLGGSAGFIIGIPADIAGFPITYAVYSYQQRESPATADPLSTLLFPSWLFWKGAMMLGAPFDAIEFAAYRAWRSEPTPSREERAAIEAEYDRTTYPSYPVKPIYPAASDRRAAEIERR
ncbi:MAG: hypothetical protein KDB80_13650, partial [Planctomycetes bacterium]|nr:hypothetical protein [Planctomycetota bacterium]